VPPASRDAPAGEQAGRALLSEVQRTLAPALASHALYALTSLESEGGLQPRHLLLLESTDPGRAEHAMVELAPQVLRDPLQHPSEAGGAWCAGAPARVCFGPLGSALALANGPLPRSPRATHRDLGAASLYLDTAEVAAALARAQGHGGRDEPGEPAHFAAALQGLKPRRVQAVAAPGSGEAWGRFAESDEPRRDGGAP
jgi:hypothetical protein